MIVLYMVFLIAAATSASKAALADVREIEKQIKNLQQESLQLTTELQMTVKSENYEQAAMYKKLIAENEERMKGLDKSAWEALVDAAEQPLPTPSDITTVRTAKDEIVRVENRLLGLADLQNELSQRDYKELVSRTQKATVQFNSRLSLLTARSKELQKLELKKLRSAAKKIADPSYYSEKSRAAVKQRIDNFLKPHSDMILGAHSTLADILEDASSQGVQLIRLTSLLSEAGFMALTRRNAGVRFQEFTLRLVSMDEAQFSLLLANSNPELVTSNGGSPGSGEILKCTFQELMKSGKCARGATTIAITDFKLSNQFNNQVYNFRTQQHLSIEESENIIYNNLQLTWQDAPRYYTRTETKPKYNNEKAVREYLYEHLDSQDMFTFRATFDGQEQPIYSVPGQGEYLSKVLHWEIAHKQLIYDLIKNNFTVIRPEPVSTYNLDGTWIQSRNVDHTPTLKNLYSQLFQYFPSKPGGVLTPQAVGLLLWNSLKDDLVSEHRENFQ